MWLFTASCHSTDNPRDRCVKKPQGICSSVALSMTAITTFWTWKNHARGAGIEVAFKLFKTSLLTANDQRSVFSRLLKRSDVWLATLVFILKLPNSKIEFLSKGIKYHHRFGITWERQALPMAWIIPISNALLTFMQTNEHSGVRSVAQIRLTLASTDYSNVCPLHVPWFWSQFPIVFCGERLAHPT